MCTRLVHGRVPVAEMHLGSRLACFLAAFGGCVVGARSGPLLILCRSRSRTSLAQQWSRRVALMTTACPYAVEQLRLLKIRNISVLHFYTYTLYTCKPKYSAVRDGLDASTESWAVSTTYRITDATRRWRKLVSKIGKKQMSFTARFQLHWNACFSCRVKNRAPAE